MTVFLGFSIGALGVRFWLVPGRGEFLGFVQVGLGVAFLILGFAHFVFGFENKFLGF